MPTEEEVGNLPHGLDLPESDNERPPFIGPTTEWVECHLCGQVISDMSRVEGIDISAPDEYYPRMVPVCPQHAPEDGDD